jgi:DNA-directed RNA polymerase specialized sigma24 family protein
MSQLSSKDQELLRLVLWEELSHSEAGEVLGCSANAVAIRLHKARRRLRAQMERQPGYTEDSGPTEVGAEEGAPDGS